MHLCGFFDLQRPPPCIFGLGPLLLCAQAVPITYGFFAKVCYSLDVSPEPVVSTVTRWVSVTLGAIRLPFTLLFVFRLGLYKGLRPGYVFTLRTSGLDSFASAPGASNPGFLTWPSPFQPCPSSRDLATGNFGLGPLASRPDSARFRFLDSTYTASAMDSVTVSPKF